MKQLKFKTNIITLTVAIVFVGVLFNVNFSLIGLPKTITSVRLSIFLLLLLLSTLIIYENLKININIFKNNILLLGFINVLFIAISVSLTFIINKGVYGGNYVISSWLQVILYFLFSVLIQSSNRSLLVNILFIITFTYLLIIFLGIIELRELGQNIYVVRRLLNDGLPQGLNRFLNGYLFLLILPICYVVGELPKNKKNLLISYLVFIASFLLLIYSGSRQYFLALCFLIIGSFLINKNKSKFLFIFLFIFLALFMFLINMGDLLSQLYIRIIEVSTEQINSGSDRFYRYSLALNLLIDNPIYGVGPGGYYELTGLYPDSGHLQFVVENGVLFYSIHLLLILSTITIFLLDSPKYSNISKIIFLYFIINIILQNFFNELFLEYYTWLVIPIIVYFKDYTLLSVNNKYDNGKF